MNRLSRMLFAAALGLAAVPAAVAGALAQEITLRLHQFLPQQANVPKLVIDEWIKRVEAAAAGKVRIEHYPSASTANP